MRALHLAAVLAVGTSCTSGSDGAPAAAEAELSSAGAATPSPSGDASRADARRAEPERPPTTQVDSPVREELRRRVEALHHDAIATGGALALHALPAVAAFYELEDFDTQWLDEAGHPQLSALVRSLEGLVEHGLAPEVYHLAALQRAAALDNAPLQERVQTELLATDAFLLAATHLLQGRVNPASIHPTWNAAKRREDVLRALRVHGPEKAEQALSALAPKQPGYARLRNSLQRYQDLAAGSRHQGFDRGPEVAVGQADPRIPGLRAHLHAVGDLSSATGDDTLDGTLAEGLRSFQQRHGLKETGQLDLATQRELAVPLKRRAEQIAVNLERWRWLPDELGDVHVRVNIPGFEAGLVRKGQVELSSRAVVGKTFRKTPVFSDQITYLVLNPRWTVPRKLATQDLLPEIRKNPGVLAERGFRVFDAAGKPVDPATVPWKKLSTTKFPYTLQQRAGQQNALGRVKFMFPNAYNIYLHDTPKRELFAEDERAFSSGCIRLEKPIELARAVLGEQWQAQRLDDVLGQGSERTVYLNAPVPVHLQYATAWTAADGRTHFRRDVYERDAPVLSALAESPRSRQDTAASGR